MKQQISSKIIALTFGVLVICFAIGFYAFAWTEPGSTPPNENVGAPINISTSDQIKAGSFTAKGIFSQTLLGVGLLPAISVENGPFSPGWIYYDNTTNNYRCSSFIGTTPTWSNCFGGGGGGSGQWVNGAGGAIYYNGGNVGIGTGTPAQKLDVSGTVKAVGLQITGGSPAVGQVLTSTDTSGTAAWQTPISGGMHFLTAPMGVAVTVNGWKTINTSSVVPAGAKVAILDWHLSIYDSNCYLMVRKDSSQGNGYYLGEARGQEHEIQTMGQGFVELTNSGTFDIYNINNGVASVRVIGYMD